VVIQSLDNIILGERESTTARATFQEVVVSSAREEISVISRLFVAEKIRGDIILKTWEANIDESKRSTKEIKEEYEEVFHSINKKSLNLEEDNQSEILGQINIIKHHLDIKESLERAQVESSQLKQVDIVQIDKWLVKTNLQLHSMMSEDKKIVDCRNYKESCTFFRQRR
jgi:hypothetical protein